ncbi:ribonuclease E domain-containing protein [Aquibacillus rhizosphaerae]|uniref:DUF5105 domain-containing protein n=1 Tax=Aquibacillus rhizosphaerae TaxID=3051431 RepID=A0ABT7L7L7_9BACI|nr:hypothetical protein [Aquibacillus sp. LR5S19]MDL4841854.1 hypothetical protein [Aquibacillus sp. LR5S19]
MKKILFISLLLLGTIVLSSCGMSESEDEVETNNNQTEEQQDELQNNQEENNESTENTSNEKEDGNSNRHENTDNTSEEQPNLNSNHSDEQNTNLFDKERAEVVLTDYKEAFNKIINNTTDNQMLLEFGTKQDLVEHFKDFMSEDLAQSMTDTYFQEKQDGLYIVPMDAPIFLQEEEPFALSKPDDETATVVQERKNELMGHVKVEYTLTKNNDSWVIDDIKTTELD